MKEFKKIAIALIGFCVCFLLLDFGVGKFFDWAIKQLPSEGERVAKSEYVINKVDADFLVIGSSRAQAHYDSKVLCDSFPVMSVFNAGVDGQLFYYINTSLNCILDRCTPKVVVWDFQLKDFVDNTPENLSLLYPSYYKNRYIKDVLDGQDASLQFTLWSNAYKYNGTAGRILRTIKAKDKGLLGYSPHKTDKSRLLAVEHVKTESKAIVADKVAEIEKTLARAKEKGVRMVLAVSPYLEQIDGVSPTLKVLQEMSEKYGCLLLDYSQNEAFTGDVTKFYDVGHLNDRGAALFTSMLANEIKNK